MLQRDADHIYYTAGPGYRAIRREVMQEVADGLEQWFSTQWRSTGPEGDVYDRKDSMAVIAQLRTEAGKG